MKLLSPAQWASRSRRPLTAVLFGLLLTILPQAAFAAEGDNVHLKFQGTDFYYLVASLAFGIIAILYGLFLVKSVMAESPGGAGMQSVGQAIKDGALAYLRRQIKSMAGFGALLFVGLAALNYSAGPLVAAEVAVSFLFGVIGSYGAGYAGMLMAVNGNMRVANAAMTSYKRSLEVAFKSGAVAGLFTVGVGLIGATSILILGGENAVKMLIGFGFGGSLAALFMRVGGGIFTKAADVGADLVGKVEAGIPEDDPRNPAVIADNVGDNVGDCAGMAADVFESYEVTLISAIILAAATSVVFDQATWTKLVIFALVAAGVGIIASLIGIASVKGTEDLNTDPLAPIRAGFMRAAVLGTVFTGILSYVLMGGMGAPIQARQLFSVQQLQQDEAKMFASIRQTVADKTYDEKTINAAIDAKATELKKDRKLVMASELFADKEKLPAGLEEVPQAAVARVIAADKTPLKPYEITAFDLVRSKELKDKGYSVQDEPTVATALSSNPDTMPKGVDLAGYQKVTDPKDKSIPALQYATNAPMTPGQPTGGLFKTVAEVFAATGDDAVVVKKIRIKADIPGTPSTNGMPARPATKIDRTQWFGPATKKTLDDQIKQQQAAITQQKLNATIEDLATEPVDLYVGPNGKLALIVSDKVDKAQQLRPSMQTSFYPTDVATMTKLQSSAQMGTAPATPPMSTIDLGVSRSTPVPWWGFFLAFVVGIALALLIEKLTEYYVSTHKKPTQEVAGVSSGGAATMIIQGFAYACESSAMMVLAIILALLCPLFIFPSAVYGGYVLGLYGVALVGIGLLSTTGYVLAMDTFGPISDNAQGVFEMSGEGHGNEKAARAVGLLDSAGNTTKALTKGFAIATAVIAAIALFHSYLDGAMLSKIGLKLDVPEIFLGLLIGGAAPYLFSSFAINAVGRSAFELINEVRRQFREEPGIMLGTVKPDYARCVELVTAAAQKELLGPGILAIALPAAVGFGFSIGKAPMEIDGHMYNLTGAQALGGFLAGAILSGQLMAVLLSNAGGMWDNAKKLIEDGAHGGKGSEAHKASVVCDTVGDPFKDTAGPALNPLIKVMNLVALLLAGVIVQPLGTPVLVLVTLIAVGALVFAVMKSKQGSMSQSLQEAQASVLSLDAAAAAEAPAKKTLKVEEE